MNKEIINYLRNRLYALQVRMSENDGGNEDQKSHERTLLEVLKMLEVEG